MNKMPILCRSIANQGLADIKQKLEGAQLAEIRIEKTGLSNEELAELFSSQPNLIATCRPEGYSDLERMDLLKTAIKSGAAWVDIEIEAGAAYQKELISYAKKNHCKVIISYHNYSNTPNKPDLNKIFEACKTLQPDLVKIATLVNGKIDNLNLLNLYGLDFPVLAIGMGDLGSITRVAAHFLGAPFIFVSTDKDEATAPGQITEKDMNVLLNLL